MGKLTDERIALITKDGLYSDGNHLYVRKRGNSLTWVGKWVRHGKQTQIGLGVYPDVTIEDARSRMAGQTMLMNRQEDPYREYRTTVAPHLLTGHDIAWLVPQLMTKEHFLKAFPVYPDLAGFWWVLQLIKMGEINARYIGRRILIETESAYRWYNKQQRIKPDDIKIDLDKLTPEEAAAVVELANGVAPDDLTTAPSKRLEAWGALDPEPPAERAAKHLENMEKGAEVHKQWLENHRKAEERKARKENTKKAIAAVLAEPQPAAPPEPDADSVQPLPDWGDIRQATPSQLTITKELFWSYNDSQSALKSPGSRSFKVD